MLLKSILVGLVYFVFRLDFLSGTSHLSRPLVISTITGIVMGDVKAGVIIGANLEMAYMGVVSIGLAALPDYVSGSILGTAFAIQTGAGPEAALGLGIPIATALMLLDVVRTPLDLIVVHMEDGAAEKASPHLFKVIFYVGGVILSLIMCVFIGAAFYFGSDVVERIIYGIPPVVSNGMNIALGLIPAVGFVLLLRQMVNKKNIPFYLIGYFMVYLFGFSTITVAIVAILIAWVITMNKNVDNNTKQQHGGELDEF